MDVFRRHGMTLAAPPKPMANCGENRVKRKGDGKTLPPHLRALRRIEHWYSSFATPCNPRLGRVGVIKLCCAAPPISYLLLNRTCHGRKHVVGIRTDQSDRTNHNNENHRQHHGIFGDVLGLIIEPCLPKNVNHVPPPVRDSRTTSAISGGVGDSGKIWVKERARWRALS